VLIIFFFILLCPLLHFAPLSPTRGLFIRQEDITWENKGGEREELGKGTFSLVLLLLFVPLFAE